MSNQHITAPIHPKQLTTERIACEWCPAGTEDTENKNICKCAGCGIATEDFIRGALIELYSKNPDYPVVLIENVSCPGVEHTKAYQEAESRATVGAGFISFEPDGSKDEPSDSKDKPNSLKDYYLEKTESDPIRIYHVFDLCDHYELCSRGFCIQRRKEEPNFKKKCTDCDLQTASDIMYGHADSLEKYKKIKYKDIDTPVYAYYCDRNNRRLVELAFPITIDGMCVAVLIIGQIDPKSAGDLETVMEEHKSKAEEITRDADEFAKRMLERTRLRKSDYFYRLLSKEYDHLTEHLSKTEDLCDAIEKLYQEIAECFDYRELVVLYANRDENSGFSQICFPKGEKGKYSFTGKELVDAVCASDEGQLKKLFQTGKDKTVRFYRQHSHTIDAIGKYYTVDCFILTFVRWEHEEPKGIKQFFDALNARLFSFLMTELAMEKQREQDILIQTFTHDLNQKLEIVGNHTSLLNAKKESWGLSPYSRVLHDINDYQKDIDGLKMQLRHFTREVYENRAGLPTTKTVRNFYPYTQFLFNLEEYYNSVDGVRELILPSVPNVTLYSSRYPIMEADPVLIERCVNNLINNAFKYSYRYTKVYLDCYRSEGNYYIEVMNFASPIRDDVRDRMFELGVSQTTLRKYRRPKGKGIGLATVKRICELHGGEVKPPINDKISEYNVPVLYRLMQELNEAGKAGILDKKLSNLKIGKETYDSLLVEYTRLLSQRVSEETNYVAFMCGAKNQLQEICYASAEYTEKLTAPYLRMALRTPTARVKFRITIPQK